MNTNTIEDLVAQAAAAKSASRILARLSTQVKNQALLNIACALETDHAEVLAANEKDYKAARSDGLDEAMLDRLLLTPERLRGIASNIRDVADLPEPVGEASGTSFSLPPRSAPRPTGCWTPAPPTAPTCSGRS